MIMRFQLTANLRRVPPHDQQRRQPEGPQVVGQQPRGQYGDGLASVRGMDVICNYPQPASVISNRTETQSSAERFL